MKNLIIFYFLFNVAYSQYKIEYDGDKLEDATNKMVETLSEEKVKNDKEFRVKYIKDYLDCIDNINSLDCKFSTDLKILLQAPFIKKLSEISKEVSKEINDEKLKVIQMDFDKMLKNAKKEFLEMEIIIVKGHYIDEFYAKINKESLTSKEKFELLMEFQAALKLAMKEKLRTRKILEKMTDLTNLNVLLYIIKIDMPDSNVSTREGTRANIKFQRESGFIPTLKLIQMRKAEMRNLFMEDGLVKGEKKEFIYIPENKKVYHDFFNKLITHLKAEDYTKVYEMIHIKDNVDGVTAKAEIISKITTIKEQFVKDLELTLKSKNYFLDNKEKILYVLNMSINKNSYELKSVIKVYIKEDGQLKVFPSRSFEFELISGFKIEVDEKN